LVRLCSEVPWKANPAAESQKQAQPPPKREGGSKALSERASQEFLEVPNFPPEPLWGRPQRGEEKAQQENLAANKLRDF